LILNGKNAEKIFSAFDYVRQNTAQTTMTEAGSSFNPMPKSTDRQIIFRPGALDFSVAPPSQAR
jgi:hypothetical protein